MARKIAKAKTKKEWPLVVYFWGIGLGLLSYAVTRVALDGYPHPLHWTSGLVGGVFGLAVGWLWYHWKGDII